MEKTIDEILFEKLHELRKPGRPHPPVMPVPPMPAPPEFGPEGMRPHGKHHGPGMHGPGFLHRERVLTVLLENEAGMHQKDILQHMKIHPSSLSELIDKLETDRYLERTVDPDDRRATLITLTEKGRARAYEVSDQRKSHMAEMFAALSDDEKQQLLVLLDKILSSAK